MVLLDLIVFIGAFVVLAYSSIWIVRSLTKIATFLKISEFAIAFILMAFATSLPELFVAIMSGISNKAVLSLGNVIGANIADITLVVGIPILLARGVMVKSKTIQRDSFHAFLVVILPFLLMLDQTISRVDGVILIFVFVLYLVKLWKEKNIFEKSSNEVTFTQFSRSIIVLFLSFIVLLLTSRFIVKYASNLAVDLGMPLVLVGLILVALGTTLPELAFGISAVLKKHKDMALGNILGSVVINSTLILGIAALISPISVGFTFAGTSAFYLVIVSFIFLVFVLSEREINWQEGIALILLYIFFIVLQLVIKGFSV